MLDGYMFRTTHLTTTKIKVVSFVLAGMPVIVTRNPFTVSNTLFSYIFNFYYLVHSFIFSATAYTAWLRNPP